MPSVLLLLIDIHLLALLRYINLLVWIMLLLDYDITLRFQVLSELISSLLIENSLCLLLLLAIAVDSLRVSRDSRGKV